CFSLYLSYFGIGAPAGTTPLRGSAARLTVNHLLNGLLAGHLLFWSTVKIKFLFVYHIFLDRVDEL
ncbi:hypothetical protein A2U01_0082600, partial [Trifolium medium]|nr:hypothetical protein [Trifolium medium]